MPDRVESALLELARTEGRLLLAVSGGLDSMVLLEAAARMLPTSQLTVATFDHGTGEAARRAAELVAARARALGIGTVVGGGGALPAREAAWRAARWQFLRDVARAAGGRIVTAHTEDDQVETIVLRAMRGAGARGLAALYAPGDADRPFIGLRRAELARYARRHRVPWIEDPSNAGLAFLRNRLRRDVIPALLRVRPALDAELLALARRAAEWRRRMDALAWACCPSRACPDGTLVVAATDVLGYHPEALAVLWPSIAGRVGLALDRRGTRRLAAFTMTSTPGAAMPLAGGWVVERSRDGFSLRPGRRDEPSPHRLPAAGALEWGRFRFAAEAGAGPGDGWSAVLPAAASLSVRAWAPADRVMVGTGLVRVKRLLSEAGIAAADRAGWPVVLADDAIVWIPGVSRVPAATARSGRPGVCIRCDPRDG